MEKENVSTFFFQSTICFATWVEFNRSGNFWCFNLVTHIMVSLAIVIFWKGDHVRNKLIERIKNLVNLALTITITLLATTMEIRGLLL